MPNEPKSFPSVIPRSSTVFTHSVCFSRFCVLLGSKGPERTERLALETSEKSIERGNNGIKGRLCMNSTVWYQEGCFSNRCFEITTICSHWTSSHGVTCLMCVFPYCGDWPGWPDQLQPKGVTIRRQVLLSRCRLWSSTRQDRLN